MKDSFGSASSGWRSRGLRPSPRGRTPPAGRSTPRSTGLDGERAGLKSLGWDVDQSDRAVGWLLTDSRGVDFKDYAVYGKGVRHKLRIV